MLFNADLFWSNVYRLIKEKGLKIGDVEEALHVSKGHISRQNKEKTSPDLKLVLGLADILKVHFSELIISQESSLTSNEKNLLEFINKVIQHTESDFINWHPEKPTESHPLIHMIEDKETRINSKYNLDGDTYLSGDIHIGYSEKIQMDIVILKVNYYSATKYQGNFNTTLKKTLGSFVEMYFLDDANLIPICSTRGLCQEIVDKVETLYTIVRRFSSRLSLDDEAKDIIIDFLADNRPEE